MTYIKYNLINNIKTHTMLLGLPRILYKTSSLIKLFAKKKRKKEKKKKKKKERKKEEKRNACSVLIEL